MDIFYCKCDMIEKNKVMILDTNAGKTQGKHSEHSPFSVQATSHGCIP